MHDPKGFRVLSGAVRMEDGRCRKVGKEYTAPTRAGGRKKDLLVFSAPPRDTVRWWRCEWEAQISDSERVPVEFPEPELLEL